MIFLAMLLVAGIGYGIAAIAMKFNLVPGRRRRARNPSSLSRQSVQGYEGEGAGEGTAWTALDELQLRRLLKDSAS